MINEPRVRLAIKTAIDSYRRRIRKKKNVYGPDFPWVENEFVLKQAAHFEDEVKPVFDNIAIAGTWSREASFFYFLARADDNNVRYDCFCLRLEIQTTNITFPAFALPIVDLYYGMFMPEDDE